MKYIIHFYKCHTGFEPIYDICAAINAWHCIGYNKKMELTNYLKVETGQNNNKNKTPRK